MQPHPHALAAACLRRRAALALAGVALALLAGCASGPSPATSPRTPLPADRDGPGDHPPADLAQVPDAEPRVEPVRPGGPNKPYTLMGRQYLPLAADPPFREQGLASWYGRKFHGRPTASGETYNMYAMTAAHPTLPIPSYLRVRNPANSRQVIVRVNDRGPFHPGRIIDLSYTAALKLDLLRGVGPVEIERITYEDIRTGAWRGGGTTPATASAFEGARTADAPAGGGSTALAGASALPAGEGAPTALAVGAQTQTQTPAVAPAAPSAAAASSALAADGLEGDAASPAATPAPPLAPAMAQDAGAPPPTPAPTPAARGFWLQLGAFRESAGAVEFQRKIGRELDGVAPLLAIFKDRSLHRLQAGPYRSRADAASAAERIGAALQLVPVIIERR